MNWKKQFKKEFAIHFSKSECQFALSFIEDLLEYQKGEMLEKVEKIHPENSGLPTLAGYNEEKMDGWIEGTIQTLQDVKFIIKKQLTPKR